MSTPHHDHAHQPNRQTLHVLLGLLFGVGIGEILNLTFGGAEGTDQSAILQSLIQLFGVVTDIFMRLIKMIIAPLVFSTRVVGMAKMSDGHTVRRVEGRAPAVR